MTEKNHLRIKFGCLADPLEDQLQRQGYHIPDPISVKRLSAVMHSLNVVYIHGLISDSARSRALKKLMKMICEAARSLEGSA
jgi:hypothetical protein